MNEEGLINGWWVFAGVLLLIAGVLNIIYGIAAIGALLTIPGSPFWSMAVFALSVIVIYKLSEGPESTSSA